ncbi:hypothetical protein K469DRAFT_552091 [Zopfia rhizophila CBS 207.26]|uniref:Fermentation associated protein n=1 Tax=Zopfia rhizophila CBS 207.26 TaxID=1314779 RepID=A0A6A6EPS7_9PEZI|nr:hypothetical protein K469DRAFT_552091 [Zopfia rhizophila CBS 207.26]
MAGSIVSEPLNPQASFNWVFLVELLICGILTVFFLFYFNRLFATLVSYGIRAYTWHTFHAYIDIQALQISLLGGRIFFKDIRYHGHNETILVHGGYITWQYWLRRVKDAEIYSNERPTSTRDGNQTPTTEGSRQGSRNRNLDKAEKGGKQIRKRLPCRISIKISGVEAFMYNRSPAYDGIIEAILRKVDGATDEERKDPETDAHVKNGSATSSMNMHDEEGKQQKLRKGRTVEENAEAKVEPERFKPQKTKPDDHPAFLRLLPIHVDCNKGAIVVGNENTTAIITAHFEKASGEFDASPCGPLDVYQQVFNFQFTHPVVHMKPNPDFKSYQLESAARLKQEMEKVVPEQSQDEKQARPKKRYTRWRSSLRNLSALFSKSTDSIHAQPKSNSEKTSKTFAPTVQFPGQERWKGLTRYLDESQNDGHGEWDAVEYAKSSLIADCPCINVSFYWDVPGPIPCEMDNSINLGPVHHGDINGSLAPEYGMDIQVYGGTINYGPWTDRHRAIFQLFFFPGSHVDAVPASPLSPGDLRVLSVFKLYLSIEDDTVLRIPVREPSKDWKWKGKAHTIAGHGKQDSDKGKGKARARRKSMRGKQRDKGISSSNVRPYAWIDVKVAANSSVNYIMDMVASGTGYQNKLDVDIIGTEISSSVNHGLLWRSGAIGLDCDLSNPLSWNSLRKWTFNISCRDLELYLLRDHLFLLIDLVADWGAGPPSDYFTFVPFQYLLNIDFADFKLYLNTNDSNIVNNPSDLDDNNFIILHGQQLHGNMTIPLDRFRPLQNEIGFDVQGHELSLDLCMPPKNSTNTFVPSKNVAQLGGLMLTGGYTYMTETSSMNTDRLFMDIRGSKLSLELYGFLVHHFMKIKDNYFGEDMHFKTLEEFQGLPSQSLAVDSTTPNGQLVKASNDLDVILCISADQVSVLVPANVYSAEKSLRVDVPYASADLRFTNYYMDLMVNFSPLSVSLGTSITSPELPNDFSGQTEIFIESVAIFGHRLFGLPPTEPTYVCSWDFDVGKISGECTSEFIERAVGAARSFAFTFDDDENTLPIVEPLIIHDSTFLRLKTQDLHIWFHVAKEAVLASSRPINLDFNDLAGATFSQRLNALVPDLTVGVVDSRSASRHRTRVGEKHTVETHAFLQTTLSFNMLRRKPDFTEERAKQQTHMQEHDQRTSRTQFLFIDRPLSSAHQRSKPQDNVKPPAMQYPEIPHPIFLFQPQGTDNGSSVSSSYYSDPVSVRRKQSRPDRVRSASTASLSHSIRSGPRFQMSSNAVDSNQTGTLLGQSSSHATSSEVTYVLSSEDERLKRHLPPSSIALSSSLASPYFPLDQIEPDLSDVPDFPALSSRIDDVDEDLLVFNDVSTKLLDENFAHTSLLIGADPGVRVHCTPEAVRCVSHILELILPDRPEDLLDSFQVDVITKILDHQKRREGKGESIEFSVRVPFIHVRFVNEFTTYLNGATRVRKDQYDLILNELKLAARVKNFPGETAGENTVSLHTTLGSLGISVAERSVEVPNDDVAVQAEITDLLLWVLKGKGISVNLSFRAFEVVSASRKMEYLASLIHRTTLLGDDLVSRFKHVSAKRQMRLQYLAWFLTSSQEQFPDPPFLTRPSYALRAARDHLRSHDSWKIISRFRYIWQCLPEDKKKKLLRQLSQPSATCPQDAEEKVIRIWDQWRTWDLAHVKKSLVMRTLYGSGAASENITQAAPLYIEIRSAGLKLIVDPGPKQSEAALRIVAINVATVPPPHPSGLMLVGADTQAKSTIVQVNSWDSSIRLSWEICELLEILLKMFQGDKPERPASPSTCPPRPPQNSAKTRENHDFQVIYVTENAKVSLDTVNLRSLSMGRRFRFSLVGSDRKASGQGETISVLMHLDQAVMELLSRSRLMLRSQFDYPSLYFTHHGHSDGGTTPDEIKIAGASRMIKFQVEEDILGCIEIIDSVLRDEVAYFHHQYGVLQQSAKLKAKPADRDKPATQLPNITVALLMDAYRVDLALLQPLTWSIAGSSGRISVVPALGHDVTLRIDYDLEAHIHSMSSSSIDGSNVISSLELPPVNGHLTVANTNTQTRIFASGIIETIHLQASEIQALIATINKPEISSVLHAIKDDMEVLKIHFEEVFPNVGQSPVVKSAEPSRDIIFGVQMTLSGLNIVASAPGQLPDSATANLAVKLASIQLKATNISSDKTILILPEVIVHLQQISMEMTLSDTETIRRCGNLTFGATFQATAKEDSQPARRVYRVRSSELEVNIFADTASAVVDVMTHLQDKIKDLDLSKEKKYLRRLRHTKSRMSHRKEKSAAGTDVESISSGALFTSSYSLELLNIQVSWIVGTSIPPYPRNESEDLVLSFRRIDLSTRKDDAARLMIEDMQLQMVPVSADKKKRSANSALLPEVVFNVAYSSTETRKLAFQAAGKSLDLRLESRFILPANVLERSIALAGKKFRAASATWNMTPTTSGAQRKKPFGNKRLASLLVDADFAGAVVHLQGSNAPTSYGAKKSRSQQKGRYSQFVGDGSTNSTALRAPGVALKIEYKDDGQEPSLNAELRIDGSNNTLYPTVVPLIIDISNSIKEVVRDADESPDTENPPQSQPRPAARLLDEDNLITADPSTILGRTRLNLGLRICKQEFSLSCQPIARVAAITKLEDIYVTVNSVKSQEHGHFFAVSAAFEKLQATVQHVYSRESTFGFDVDSIVLSLMNSKHLSGTSGISAILKINPMRLQVNARQLQDFLLFREIWVPPEIRKTSKPPTAMVSTEPQEYLIQRYQQVTAATAFPWNANIAIADVSVELDLGQAIGKTSLNISNLWASSKKSTTWEQNLCIGVEKVGIESSGRTSGFVELAGVRVRTSISWPSQTMGIRQTPLVQASLGFHQLRIKAGFDYQAFVIADISNFDFLMYNVREQLKGAKDRLVAILNGDKVHVFCTATSAAQGLALYQAIERLVQENQQAYKQSLKDIEKFLRRKSSVVIPFEHSASQSMIATKPDEDKTPISLHTDVVVTLRSINLGVFPSTFVDSQIFMLEASDAQARFAVALEEGKIHSGLGMTLGQLSVALSSIPNPKKAKPVADLIVEDVVDSARSARGGTILRVPKVIATMHTWQAPERNHIDYIFRSSLEGKVDVGWNYSRISYIRTMWSNHSRTLASRLGKPLPESAVKITSSSAPSNDPSTPQTETPETPGSPGKKEGQGQEKITAVVNVPQSRYEYTALETPLIETPQLRDMGEATPPLEWIGLHRDRLPNVTHQIVIVTLLEVAREVEDAYERILGSS